MLPACRMQSLDEKGDGGEGTQTCEPMQPPPTAVGWQALAVSAQADGGLLNSGVAGQLPP